MYKGMLEEEISADDDDFNGYMTPLISVQRSSIIEEDPEYTKSH